MKDAFPMRGIVTMKSFGDRVLVDGVRILDYVKERNAFIVQIENDRYMISRLCIQLEEFEGKNDIEERRVRAHSIGKSTFLRLNIERIIFEEILRMRPELR